MYELKATLQGVADAKGRLKCKLAELPGFPFRSSRHPFAKPGLRMEKLQRRRRLLRLYEDCTLLETMFGGIVICRTLQGSPGSGHRSVRDM